MGPLTFLTIMKLIFFLAALVALASGFPFSKPDNYKLLCVNTGAFRCQCPEDDTKNVVDCAEKAIQVMPNGVAFPDHITEVTLSKNSIKDIPNTVFTQGLGIKRLDLSHNLINYLANDAFAGLENLVELDLSNNEIWSISIDVFRGLSYISTLNLAFNKINDFYAETFKGCDNLLDLSLSHNAMLSVGRDMFSYLHGLQSLDLSSTQLSDLPATIFSNNSQLHNLLLTGNSFITVPTRAILSATNLRLLDMSENPIEKIPSQAFSGASSLEALRVTHMRNLHTVKEYSFSGLDKLTELYITDNLRLTRISNLAFKKFRKPKVEGEDESKESEEEEDSVQHPSLKKLSLRHNGLQYLPEDLLDWKQLTDLDLRENPWQCDCHLAWIANEEVSEAARKGAVCATPKRLAGRAQSSLVESDYTCHYLTAEATVALSVVVVAAFVLALVGIAFLMYKRSLIKCRCRRRDRTQPKYTRVVSTKDKVDLEWDHSGEPPSSTDA